MNPSRAKKIAVKAISDLQQVISEYEETMKNQVTIIDALHFEIGRLNELHRDSES